MRERAQRAQRLRRILGGLGLLCPLILTPQLAGAEDGKTRRTAEQEWEEMMGWGTPQAQETQAETRHAAETRGSSRGSTREPKKAKPNAKSRPSKLRAKPVKKGVSPGYQALSAQWHAPPASDTTYLSDTTPALVFHVVGMQNPIVVLVPEELGGPFDPEQLEAAREAFRTGPKGPPVNERLLGLIHRATRHFEVPYVHLVSGVRQDRGASRHTHGLAADIVLPGITDEELAEFLRAQGFVGVGVYTRSGFVHVDVRERSFFWIDPSPPGKSMKIIPVLAADAVASDKEAIARGEEPLVNPTRLSRALEKRNAVRRKKAIAQAKRATEKKPPETLTASVTRERNRNK